MAEKKVSKFQIWVTAVGFLGLLFVPSVAWVFCHNVIGDDTSENRALAEMPDFRLDNIELLPNRIEKAYNDHTPFRKVIRTAWSSLNLFGLRDSTSEKVLIGKNDNGFENSWLFYTSETDNNPVKDAQGLKVYDTQVKDATKIRIQRETEKYKQRGIKLYYLVAPNKEDIYKEELPDNVKIYSEKTRTQDLTEYLEQNEIRNYYFAYDDILRAKDLGQLYYRQDTHWNKLGAFVGFKGLMGMMGYEANLKSVDNNTNEKAKHDLASILGASWYFKDEEVNIEYDVESTNKRIVIVGDSFRTALREYLEKAFSKVTTIHRDDRNKEIVIEKEKPDIVIYEFVERASNSIKDFSISLK